jgi:uncharacterized protein
MSLHQFALTTFQRHLSALSKILSKAAAYAAEKKFDESVLVNARLSPDMFALARQVQIAGDFAKGCMARLSDSEIPKYDDTEKTLAELQARIQKTLDFIAGIDAAKFAGCESKALKVKLGGTEYDFTGETYVRDAALPHFYFHATTAYAILRAQGLAIGKLDYLGQA